MKKITTTTVLALAVVQAGCGEAAPPSVVSDLPERYLLQSAPEGAQDVGAARAGATDGATVAVRGVVGGSESPFVDGLAAFTIVDPALESCVGEAGGCETPWDYCCVPPETIAENSVTIEFREGDAPVVARARGFHGLDYLATVVVEGAAERDAQGNVTIVASGIRVVDP
jgi:hypothetical protein